MLENEVKASVILVDLNDGKAWDLTDFAEELKSTSILFRPKPDLINALRIVLYEIGFNNFRIMNACKEAAYLGEMFDDIDVSLGTLISIADAPEDVEIFKKVKEVLMG